MCCVRYAVSQLQSEKAKLAVVRTITEFSAVLMREVTPDGCGTNMLVGPITQIGFRHDGKSKGSFGQEEITFLVMSEKVHEVLL